MSSLSLPFAPRQVACGSFCTLVRTIDGEVFSWGGYGLQAAPPSVLRASGVCGVAAGGGHCAVTLGAYPTISATDVVLARRVGFQLPADRASMPPSLLQRINHPLTVSGRRVTVETPPEVLLREVHELQGLLTHEKAKRDACNLELMHLQQQVRGLLLPYGVGLHAYLGRDFAPRSIFSFASM